MNIVVRIEYDLDLSEYSDARLRELLCEAEALRDRVIVEVRKRLAEKSYNMYNLDFLGDEDRARILSPCEG